MAMKLQEREMSKGALIFCAGVLTGVGIAMSCVEIARPYYCESDQFEDVLDKRVDSCLDAVPRRKKKHHKSSNRKEED